MPGKQISISVSDATLRGLHADVESGKAKSRSQRAAQILAEHYETPSQNHPWGKHRESHVEDINICPTCGNDNTDDFADDMGVRFQMICPLCKAQWDADISRSTIVITREGLAPRRKTAIAIRLKQRQE